MRRPWLAGVLLLAALAGAAPAGAADEGCAATLLRAGDGAPVVGADAVRGTSVRAVVAGGRGGWYVGGEFWRVGSVARHNLAHLDRSGRLDRRFGVQLDGRVTALALSGRALYAVGGFRHANGAARAGAAAFDAVTGRLLAWRPMPPAEADAVAVAGGVAYLGSTASIVAADAQTASPLPAVAIPAGSPLAVAGGIVYAKSGRGYYGGLVAYDAASGRPLPSPADARGFFSSMFADGRRLLATGRFAVDERRHVGLAAWDAGSGKLLWTARVSGAFVNTLAVAGGRVYLGGLLDALDGQKRPRLGAVALASGRAVSWTPRWNASRAWTPLAVAATADRVFVGAAVASPGTNLPPCARRS